MEEKGLNDRSFHFFFKNKDIKEEHICSNIVFSSKLMIQCDLPSFKGKLSLKRIDYCVNMLMIFFK
jgi:hypothetical protein